MTHRHRLRRARGFSLTEILVVLGIIVVLVGMLIPAIEAARRAARSTQCLSNMHQIGLALHSYMADQVNFPPGISPGGYSPQAALLPYLQSSGVSAQIDRGAPWDGGVNATAAGIEVEHLRCPSDKARRLGVYGRVNYVASNGIAFAWAPPGQDPVGWKTEGVFTPGWDIELEDVRDGASVTAAFAEHGTGDWSNLRTTRESDYYAIEKKDTADEIRAQLIAVDPKDRKRNKFSEGGAPWIGTHSYSTHYSHDGLPGDVSGYIDDDPPGYVTSAASYHGKGSNLLLCDGAARWVSRDIDPVTWRSLGTFQGEDPVDTY